MWHVNMTTFMVDSQYLCQILAKYPPDKTEYQTSNRIPSSKPRGGGSSCVLCPRSVLDLIHKIGSGSQKLIQNINIQICTGAKPLNFSFLLAAYNCIL